MGNEEIPTHLLGEGVMVGKSGNCRSNVLSVCLIYNLQRLGTVSLCV